MANGSIARFGVRGNKRAETRSSWIAPTAPGSSTKMPPLAIGAISVCVSQLITLCAFHRGCGRDGDVIDKRIVVLHWLGKAVSDAIWIRGKSSPTCIERKPSGTLRSDTRSPPHGRCRRIAGLQ